MNKQSNRGLLDLPFDQYSRQQIVQQIVNHCIRVKNERLKILDVGGYKGQTLEFFPNDEVVILDVFEIQEPHYVCGDGANMEFADSSFDLVCSFDVLEHIPKNKRTKFIEECNRVSKKGFFVAAPMDNDMGMVATTESYVDKIYSSIHHQHHPWLKEHSDNGLPKRKEIEATIGDNKLQFERFESNNLLSWFSMQGLIFMRTILDDKNSYLGEDFAAKVRTESNRFYNTHSASIDDLTPLSSYRNIYFISKQTKLVQKVREYKKKIKSIKSGNSLAANLALHNTVFSDILRVTLGIKDEAQRQISYYQQVRQEHLIYKQQLDAINRSLSWRATKPLRRISGMTRRIMDNSTIRAKKIIKSFIKPFMPLIVRLLYLRVAGRRIFINRHTRRIPIYARLVNRVDAALLLKHSEKERELDYEKWLRKNPLTKKQLEDQRIKSLKLSSQPLISILVPVYNPDIEFLKTCIDSVLAQTYQKWELCLADDASPNEEVRRLIKEYANKDKRIKYVFRKHNGHICKATNSALDLATGEYIALLDDDDYLWPNALYEAAKAISNDPEIEFLYSDEDKIDTTGRHHENPFFKPGWSPEYLRSVNYITHFSVLRRQLVKKIGGLRVGYEGAQDWDLFLRVSRETDKVVHIPKILYSWRKSDTSTASTPGAKEYAYINQKKALADDVKDRGLIANIDWQIPLSMWRVNYVLPSEPLVSIIIPTKNQLMYISQCLESVITKTVYGNYEIVIVDTGSTEQRVWELYEQYQARTDLKVVKWTREFNFSGACNFGVSKARGQYLLFLNNDTELISPNWLGDMVGYASQRDIGAVGCKLYYPTGQLQHGGIILGVGGQGGTPGIAGHFFPAFRENPPQDPGQLLYDGGTRNFAAVTAACLMVSREKYDKVKGFDTKFKIAFNDVDFCLKLLKSNYRNVYLPHVELYHHESISIGRLGSKVRDPKLFAKEIAMMLSKWGNIIENDPYYHPEFRRDIASARLKVQ